MACRFWIALTHPKRRAQMHESENRDRSASIVRWLCYSVVIPALAIFLRWLVSYYLYGPARVHPLSMLRSSEVVFLAGVIVAETLGEAPSRGTLTSRRHRLVMIQGLLMVLLVLSLMVFGAFMPFETTDISGGPTWWVSSPEGQAFLTWFNSGLFAFVFATAFWARWQYLSADQAGALGDIAPQSEAVEGVADLREPSGAHLSEHSSKG
jgi:hypothetical protein